MVECREWAEKRSGCPDTWTQHWNLTHLLAKHCAAEICFNDMFRARSFPIDKQSCARA
jgi:hypothetical protein